MVFSAIAHLLHSPHAVLAVLLGGWLRIRGRQSTIPSLNKIKCTRNCSCTYIVQSRRELGLCERALRTARHGARQGGARANSGKLELDGGTTPLPLSTTPLTFRLW